MVHEGRLIVATDERGASALKRSWPSQVTAVPVGTDDAEVLWRRHGISGQDVARAFARMPALQWLHTDTAGVEDLPLTDLAAHGVTVTKTRAYTMAVAEWIVTAVLMAAKDVPAYLRASDERQWRPAAGATRLLSTSQALIIGNGDIGSSAASMLRGMGVQVRLASRGSPTWWSLLPQVDWLILACPLTARTRGLVSAPLLSLLKPDAWLVNVARGEVVDETALVAALDAGRLGGAVLDTFCREPLPPQSPLWGRKNVVVLPHDAWRARGADRRQVSDFLDQLQRYRNGQPLRRTVDAAAGY